VRYSDSFYDEVCQGFIGRERKEVFSIVAFDLSCGHILGCIICQFVEEATCADEGLIRDRPLRSSALSPSLLYILTLGTAANTRRRGIARSLLEAAFQRGREEINCEAIYLHVITYNTIAIKFYEKNGFTCLRRIEEYYHIEQKL
jgi:ribosomal protein S18 acetylase RimI-like enzyme